MSIDATLDGSAVPVDAILLRSQANNGLTMASAADGVGSQGSVVFDDPDGSLDVRGWMPVTIDEPDCTTAPRLFTGYVYDRVYRRGQYKSGAARQIDTTLNDLNAVMSFRIIDGADGKRPIETDTARLAWILGSDYLSGLIADLGFVTPSGQNLDEADFRGQYPADVINSCVLGRLFFAYWDQGVEACGLFFDLPDATTYTSTFSVSNVIADNSSTCLYPLLDAELDVSPDEVYSKVRFTFLSGVIVRSNATTASTFFPSPVLTRGKEVDSTRIGKLATAENQAAIELARSSQEKKTLTFAIRVRSEDVGLIDAGMRMSVRFTHLPGFETATYVRIQQRTVAPTESDRGWYDMLIRASNLGLPVIGTGGGSGDPGNFPNPPCPSEHWYSGTFSDAATTGSPDVPMIFTSWPFESDMTYNYSVTVDSLDAGHDGLAGFRIYRDSNPTLFPLLIVDPMSPGMTYTGSFTTGTGTDEPAHAWLNLLHNDIAPGNVQVTFWVDPDGWVAPECEPPAPGQWVGINPPEVVTMTGADGTTAWPFADGSLRVFVDNVEQTANLVSQDGVTGDFTLGFTPTPTEVVTVQYQGR